ncbi:MAG: FtsW/RodA/SpoVE family cell cycle protein [Lachnospiraceae bacterium]|nr:FtsW/RodA/SpoVE family cell cycle protein [Lachnospiraceae bacterium]
MVWYIKEFSKYGMVVFAILYTYEAFAVFRYEEPETKNGIYIRQGILLFLIHVTGFVTIYVSQKEPDILYLFLGIFELVVLFSVMVLARAIYTKVNRLIVNNMCMLLSIGFIILARISLTKAVSQFKIVIVSLIIGMAIPYFVHKIRLFKYLTWIYAMVGIAALTIVLLVGAVTNGSKISYRILGYTFQPSEFVKILYVFLIASLLYESDRFIHIVISAVLAGAHVIILVLSRDLGSALIFFVVYVCLIFIATKNYIYLILGIFAGCTAAMGAYHFFSHVQVRVQAWQDPWNDIAGTGYQITQSLFAMGTGGWFGLGLGQGTPSSIPFVESDFVFSAVAEEMGLLFAICLLLICLSCFIMFMKIASQLRDAFYRYIAAGLGIIYIFQVFLTVGGGTKFIPLTGVTLPFISYGGSSILTTIIMFFIIQGLYMIRYDEQVQQTKSMKKLQKKK